MINLLPPDVKESMIYARRNTRLRHWIVAILCGLAGIFVIVGAGQLYLQQSIHAYEQQVAAGQLELKAQKLDETQAKVQQLSGDLKLVVSVLQKEVLFSKLLSKIGAALPPGSVLTNLSINKVQGGIDLQAATADSQTATQLQLNLQDPKNQIFDKADLVSIQCASNAKATSGDPLKSQYPCTAQLRALFSKNNSFTFIGGSTPGASGSQTGGGTKP